MFKKSSTESFQSLVGSYSFIPERVIDNPKRYEQYSYYHCGVSKVSIGKGVFKKFDQDYPECKGAKSGPYVGKSVSFIGKNGPLLSKAFVALERFACFH